MPLCCVFEMTSVSSILFRFEETMWSELNDCSQARQPFVLSNPYNFSLEIRMPGVIPTVVRKLKIASFRPLLRRWLICRNRIRIKIHYIVMINTRALKTLRVDFRSYRENRLKGYSSIIGMWWYISMRIFWEIWTSS